MAATITAFGEWHTREDDPWDANLDTFYPDFDYDAAITPSVTLQSSLCPDAPLVLLMSTPAARLAVAPFAARPCPGSGLPVRHCAFSGDLVESNLPAIINWTEDSFAPVLDKKFCQCLPQRRHGQQILLSTN